MVLTLPRDWWQNPATQHMTACSVMVDECVKLGGGFYLNCTILKPDSALKEGQILQLPVSKTPYNLRKLLELRYNSPATLADL